MRIVDTTWTELKSFSVSKGIPLQYTETDKYYFIWFLEGLVEYNTKVLKTTPGNTDQTDFEGNYRAEANAPVGPKDEDGKQYIRAESRPLDMTTYFTSKGDGATTIGDGNKLVFNFNNTDDDVASPPAGTKQKKVTCTFIDAVRIKEGTLYWQNMPFGSKMDLCIGVPDQGWYKKNDGSYAQNTTGDVMKIDQFVNSSPMMGDCPMGDELNTEAASDEIPAGMVFGFTVTVPDSVSDTDNVRGAVQMELYRRRTVIL